MHCWKREALTEKIFVRFQLCNVQNPEQNRTAAFGGVGVGSSGKMLKKSKGVITVKVTVSSPLGEKEGVTERERERKGGHCPAPQDLVAAHLGKSQDTWRNHLLARQPESLLAEHPVGTAEMLGPRPKGRQEGRTDN